MIILTNNGNPLGLELYILSLLKRKHVKIVEFDLKAKDISLPILELDDGAKIFSNTAAARLLFPGGGKLCDEWLEWSNNVLAPALFIANAPQHRDNNGVSRLSEILKKLDYKLKETTFLTGNELSSADIAVWTLLSSTKLINDINHLKNIVCWHNRISCLPETITALREEIFANLKISSMQSGSQYVELQNVYAERASVLFAKRETAELSSNLADADAVTEIELKNAKYFFGNQLPVAEQESRTVLPSATKRNILITSALPYVNNVPHLGNIIGCVLSADIFARYARLVGYNALFICGTDEYGTATENKALLEGCSPKEICDKYFELHNSIYRWFGIGFDYFGRTSTMEQTQIVQEAFKRVFEAGYILKDNVEQLFCETCDRFLADRFVEGTCPHPGCEYEDARGDQCDKCGKLVNATELIRPRCKMCKMTPVVCSSDQLFLDLPKIEPKLKAWFNESENGWTNNARVITRAWLREGLKPRCITRDLKWGITVPLTGFEKKVFYVWFDAPFGYISMTKKYTKDYLQWWEPSDHVKVELFQFMAKDNVPFHSVMWPASLLAINRGHTMVSHIMATEYLNYEDGKFSKSRGIGVFGNDAQDTGIAADVWRFYLASTRPEGQDSSFSWNDLATRNNSDLLNNMGNFINRALVFCEKNFNSIIPSMNLKNDDLIVLALVNRELNDYFASLQKARLRDGIRHLLAISRHGNCYMQARQPWLLVKGGTEQMLQASTVIALCCNIVCLIAHLLIPYMATTARNLLGQLNAIQVQLNPKKPFTTMLLQPGHRIGKPMPLFTKLEQTFIDDLKKKYAGQQVPISSNTDTKK